jgi:hypothetical protein
MPSTSFLSRPPCVRRASNILLLRLLPLLVLWLLVLWLLLLVRTGYCYCAWCCLGTPKVRWWPPAAVPHTLLADAPQQQLQLVVAQHVPSFEQMIDRALSGRKAGGAAHVKQQIKASALSVQCGGAET